MAIVKMKHLRLFGMSEEREGLLSQLQTLGCVEIRQPAVQDTDSDWTQLVQVSDQGLTKAKEESILLQGALDALNRCQREKTSMFTPKPEVSRTSLFDAVAHIQALETASAIQQAEKEMVVLTTEQSKRVNQKASLAPWVELDIPLETEGTGFVSATFGTVMSTTDLAELTVQLQATTELAQLIPAGKDREFQYVLLLCHRSAREEAMNVLKSAGFALSPLRGWQGTAKENVTRLEAELAQLDRELEAVRSQIATNLPQRGLLQQVHDRIQQDIQKETVKSNLLESRSTFFLEGWYPAEEERALTALLGNYTLAWAVREPEPEEYPQVPVQLKNNAFTKPLNMVTEMYALPAYDGLDPNPLMAPFFILFYGIMMADMGYGLVMMLASFFVLKKAKPIGGMYNLFALLGLCGISTFAIGAMTGSFFGDFIPQLLKLINPDSTFALPALFTPLDDTLAILVGSLVLGFVQVITGMAVNVYKQTVDGKFRDALFNEIAWWLILAGGASMVLCGFGSWALLPGAVLLVAGQFITKGLLGGLGGLVGAIYNGVTGLFSDVLSYSRLMALMLAGSIISSVFNTLGSVANSILPFIIISMLGNALNFGLNVLGCYVHDLRLQCLEYFGRFYKDGGKAFRPLSINTTYVNIIKEEQ